MKRRTWRASRLRCGQPCFPSVAILLMSIVFALSAKAQPTVNGFLDFSTAGLPGRLLVPTEAANSARPLVLFLHGAGETGSDNVAQINSNINNLVRNARLQGAFVYAPQAQTFGWNRNRNLAVMSQIDEAIVNYNIDTDRIYVTGLSMGGGGTWNIANANPDRFAAAVPIAGVPPSSPFDGANFHDLPTWAFHARNDGIVPALASQFVVDTILAAAGQSPLTYPPSGDRVTDFQHVNPSLPLRYTEWARGGHGIWGRVYGSTEMNDWMWAQALPEPASQGMLWLLTLGVVACRRKSVLTR